MTTFLLEAVCADGHKRTVRVHSRTREAAEQLAIILAGTAAAENVLACKVCGRHLPPFTIKEVPAAPAHANGAASGK